MPQRQRKPNCDPARSPIRAVAGRLVRPPIDTERTLLFAGLVALFTVGACSARPQILTVSLRTLEEAAAARPGPRTRVVVSDLAALGDAFRPLGARLGLVQVNSTEQWERLARLAPGLGPCPDLAKGSVVGLASTIGIPLNGRWPIHVQSVREHEGAGLLVARFDGGSYLPDGTTYLETVYVPDLATVLVVEVNGVRFYPD